MAIALVGTPTTTCQAFGSTSIVISFPAGLAANMVAYCAVWGTGTGTITATGWTTLANSGAGGNGWGAQLLRRVLDGSEGASVTFNIDAGDNVTMAAMRMYSGVNTSTPEDTASGNPKVAFGATGQPNNTSLTTVQANGELLFFCMTNNGLRTYTAPTGFGAGSLNNSGNGETIASFDKALTTAGATGAVTTAGGTSGDNWVAMLVALQPSVVVGGWRPPIRHKKPLVGPPYRRKVRQTPREFNLGFPLLFSAIHPLRGYPLRADKPIPRKVRPIQKLRRRVTAFNILIFYFTAPRHIRPHRPAVIKRWKRMNPHAYSATAALLFWALSRRAKPRKQVPPKLIKRRWWRRLGAMAVAGSPTLVAFIKQRRRRPFPQAHSRMPLRTRRASSGAGLLFMLAAPRRKRKKLPLKLPLVIGALPMRRYRRIGGGIAALFFFIAAPRRRRHLPPPEPVAAPPPWKRRKTMRERYVAFVAAVGATLDAIVNWRARGGY